MIKGFRGRYILILAMAGLATSAANAQNVYPNKRIAIVVAAGAGGFADALARLVGEQLSTRFKQSVLIENRGGAGGNIAARTVATSPPDGYTLLAATTSMAINGSLYQKMNYATKDITPVAIIGSSPEVIVVNPAHDAKTLAQFLKPADGLPIQFGTAGNGSGSHIAAEYLFRILAKTPAQHVPFPGGAPAINNVIANQLNSVVATMPALAPHIQAGKLRGLAVASARRQASIPDVPTLGELGYPNYYAASWLGFFLPSATDKKIIEKLNAEINSTLETPAIRARMEKMGLEIMTNDVASTNTFFQNEIGFWRKRVNAIGVKIR